jgi:hypothetical protein
MHAGVIQERSLALQATQVKPEGRWIERAGEFGKLPLTASGLEAVNQKEKTRCRRWLCVSHASDPSRDLRGIQLNSLSRGATHTSRPTAEAASCG